MNDRFFNQGSIDSMDIRTAPSGFRYGFASNVLHEEKYEILRQEFPDPRTFKRVDKISGGGHKLFYVGPGYVAGQRWGCACDTRSLSGSWQAFMAECASSVTTRMLSKRTGVSFNSVCNFGLTYGNEGCMQEAHVDGAVREYDESPVKATWTAILYFNKYPEGPGGTCIYDTDRTTVLFQAPSMRNGLFFFEQHPQAWHGFPVMPKGAERHILALAYANEPAPIHLKLGWGHRLRCRRFWKSVARQ